jgi:hypothetical protein
MFISNETTGFTAIDRSVLPVLSGSEKQIAWATELRDSRINKICNDMDNMVRNLRAAGKTITPEQIAEGRARVWEANKAEILETSAKVWIDRR